MASIWRRSRCSRCWSSSPSRTSCAIFSASSRSARASLAQPRTRRTRASTSTVSSSSTFRSVDSSGHQPTRSASAPGSSPATEPRIPLTCRLPRCSNSARRVARSSTPSLRASSVMTGSSTASAVTHSPLPVPTTPWPTCGPADGPDHERVGAPGQLPGRLDLPDHADLGVPAPDPGHEQEGLVAGLGRLGRSLRLVGLQARSSPPSPAAGHRREGAGQAACCGQWSWPRGASRARMWLSDLLSASDSTYRGRPRFHA